MSEEQTPGAASTNTGDVHGTGECEWFMVMVQGARLGFKGEEGRDGAGPFSVKMADLADPRLH